MAQRGGGYVSSLRTIRSANRKSSAPQGLSYTVGFRIARTRWNRNKQSR